MAVIELLKRTNIALDGKNVVIVGRSNIVGKPLAGLFLLENATVTMCHSKTRNLQYIMIEADILVIAAPIKEGFYPFYTSVIVDISGVYAKQEGKLQSVCEYTKHIGKLTVAVLLKRIAQYKNK